MPRHPQRPRSAPVLLALLLALLVTATTVTACTGGTGGDGDGTVDPDAAQRARLTQQAAALGIPAGYPGPQNTGVPLGTVLEPSGSVSATKKGQVVENLDIRGCLSIKADDVVVRNVRISCGDKQRAVVIEGSRSGILVEDSEIDGLGSTQVAIGWGGYTLRRVNVHSILDGPRLGSGVTVEDSWIHDLVREDGFHSDALQANGGTGIVVRHNSLDPTNLDTGDPLNSAVQLGAENDSGKLSGVTIEDNYLNGGNYTVNVRDDDGITGIVLRDNVFGNGARYGPVIAPSSVELAGANTTTASGSAVESVEP